MKIKRLIAAAMAVTAMFSEMSVNAAAAQPQAHISSTGTVYYDKNTVTDVEIISSRIINQDNKNCNTINLNVGIKVYLGNIFKLADGYGFDDFTYEISDSQGDKHGTAKIIESSGKYYLKTLKEGYSEYLRVFYKNKLVAGIPFCVSDDYESAAEISVSTKKPKIGQQITLKALTADGKDEFGEYADCCWIIAGDSSWEFPIAWYTNWNLGETDIWLEKELGDDWWFRDYVPYTCSGKATLSFNDFGKVKIYCLSPNGKLNKVTINVEELAKGEYIHDGELITENRDIYRWSGNEYHVKYEEKIGYTKPDGTCVFTHKDYLKYNEGTDRVICMDNYLYHFSYNPDGTMRVFWMMYKLGLKGYTKFDEHELDQKEVIEKFESLGYVV